MERIPWGGRATSILSTTLIALVSCTGNPSTGSVESTADTRPRQLPADIASACAEAKDHAAESFPVLCPSRLPRATVSSVPGNPPAPLRAVVIKDERGRAQGLEFSYSAPDERHPERNHPDRFFHFALLGGGSGFATPLGDWEDLGEAEFGVRRGRLYFVAVPSYHMDHLVFEWREGEERLVASLHSWERTESLRLLDRLVSGLTIPTKDGPPPRLDARVMTTQLGHYGAIKVAVGPESAWALGYTQGKLFPLDPENGVRSGPPIEVGRYPTDFVFEDGTMWVARHDDSGTDPNEDGVLRVSRADGVTDVLAAGESPSAIALARGRVWVTDFVEDTLRALDRTTGRVAFGPVDLGGALVAASAYRRYVLVLDTGRSQILWVDTASGKTVRRKVLVGGLGGMAVDDGSIWVTDHGSRRLIRVDAASGQVMKKIPLPGMPGRVAAANESVWVTDYWDGRLIRVNARTNRVEDQIYVGGHPLEVAVGAGAVWIVNDGEIQRIGVGE
jgi:YVTN family beta-propeller protein